MREILFESVDPTKPEPPTGVVVEETEDVEFVEEENGDDDDEEDADVDEEEPAN